MELILNCEGTVMEAAKRQGMNTGLITTSYICDATPAAFSSHSLKREFRVSLPVSCSPNLQFLTVLL